MVWSDNPGRVNERKGYGAVNWLYRFAIIRGTDSVHPGSNRGCSQQLFPLAIGLVLVVGWAAQYVVDGGPGLDGSSELAVILSATGVASIGRAESRIYPMRWRARISFSTRNFRVQHLLVSCPWSLW